MLDKNYFEKEVTGEPTKTQQFVGAAGAWGLHIAKILFLVYSGYHGISASINYAGSSEIAKAAQIFGIIVLEITLFSLYLAWYNQKITGVPQSIAACITYAIGFVLACLGIIADSQLHSNTEMSGWLVTYLKWGLPIAPAFMGLGSLLTHTLSPEQLRQRKEAFERLTFEQEQFAAYMAAERAKMDTAKRITNMTLNAQSVVAQRLVNFYTSEKVQAALEATALKNAPAIFRAIGVDLETDVSPPLLKSAGETIVVDDGGIINLQQIIDQEVAKRSVRTKARVFDLDILLEAMGTNRDEAVSMLKYYKLNTPDAAYTALDRFKQLPDGMDLDTFTNLYNELMKPNGVHKSNDFLSQNQEL